MAVAPGRAVEPAIVPFEVRLTPNRGTIHVEPVGELDLATTGELRDEVEELVATGFAHVLVDLRGLRFIDCAGVRLLLELDGAARREGWRLTLIQGRDCVRRLFELTGSLEVLTFT